MKLSLSFQPFVKPVYKQFCIQKIQQTVSQIKQHLQFSKKQNIYQSNVQKQKKSSSEQKQSQIFNSTLKKPTRFSKISAIQNQFQQTQLINFRHSTSKRQQKMFSDVQQKLQQEQLIQFMTKVQNTLSYHTRFYQNLIQKTKLMNQKQENLQKLISELRGITKAKGKQKQNALITFQNLQDLAPLSSMTFRNNNFLDVQNEVQLGNDGQTMRHVSQFSNVSLNSLDELNNKSSELYTYLIAEEESKLKDTDFPIKKPNKQYKAQSPQNQQKFVLHNDIGLSNISQNADFLITFMRLQQQFNKIKKKSQFQNCQIKKNESNSNPKFSLMPVQ